jgi:hypothetical protein
MVYSKDIRCGALNIEVNKSWVHTTLTEMGYVEINYEGDEKMWEFKFNEYCNDLEGGIFMEHAIDHYSRFNWIDHFLENCTDCIFFDDLFEMRKDW